MKRLISSAVSSQYSKKTLTALSQILSIHRALIWINPVTNSIDVKRVLDRAKGVVKPPSEVNLA